MTDLLNLGTPGKRLVRSVLSIAPGSAALCNPSRSPSRVGTFIVSTAVELRALLLDPNRMKMPLRSSLPVWLLLGDYSASLSASRSAMRRLDSGECTSTRKGNLDQSRTTGRRRYESGLALGAAPRRAAEAPSMIGCW
jgi:hypothetical protein